jgi:hypothetical protein
VPSFRGAPTGPRKARSDDGANPESSNLGWIPGSLALLAPRNDGVQIPYDAFACGGFCRDGGAQRYGAPNLFQTLIAAIAVER